MSNQWRIDAREFRVAQHKLEIVTEGVGRIKGQWNTQAWIHQKEINKRLISLIEQIRGEKSAL